jgi:hypothetical protein
MATPENSRQEFSEDQPAFLMNMSPTEKTKEETNMKRAANKAICFWKAWNCVENRRELQENSSVLFGSLLGTGRTNRQEKGN